MKSTTAPSKGPLRDATDFIDNSEMLQRIADEEGYLFIRGLLPQADIAAARRAMLEVLAANDWIDDQNLDMALPNMDNFCVEPEPAYLNVYYQQLSRKELNELQHHPKLIEVFRSLLGGEVLAHPRITARNIFPHRLEFTTAPHQDYIHIQGTTNHYAAWVCLGDCEQDMGGLEIARGSHRLGVLDIRPCLGAGQLEIVCDEPLDWRYSPVQAGDVIIHNCLTVHRGRPNHTDRLRLSMDYRYQRVDEAICERSLNPSHQLESWENLYRGWQDDDYKYYWQNLNLDVHEFDFKYFDQRDEAAIQMGLNGDPVAMNCLEGAVQKHRDPNVRARAHQALTHLKSMQQSGVTTRA